MVNNEMAQLWLILATILVLSMQAGFLMLEGGRVRAKNSINVAQKNITDLIVVWVVFFACGCFFMFGTSIGEITAGSAGDAADGAAALTPLHFIFQLAFCSTAATIVSGAIAERFSFKAYLVLVAIIAAFIYPIVGRLVWGDAFNTGVSAHLADLGFIDYAGSTVVHGVGAWVALVAVIMVGSRTGRFDEQGHPQVMPAFNAVISLFGVFILVVGWLGFNGGSLAPNDPRLPSVLFNTLTAGVFGGSAGMAIGVLLDKGVFNPGRVTSGLLGGLVACSASVVYMGTTEAVLVGLGGGSVATIGAHVLLHRFKLDDPLDCVAIHGLAGVFGTLAVAFVMPVSEISSQSRLIQFAVQGAGIVAVFTFTAVSTGLFLSVIKRFVELRVPLEAERIGLNYTEHGESIGTHRLQNALESKLDSASTFASGISIDKEDEHSELAATVNQLISRYESASSEIRNAQQRFKHFAETASDWLWEADSHLILTFLHANSDSEKGKERDNLDALLGENLFDVLDIKERDLETLKSCMSNNQITPAMEATLYSPEHNLHGIDVEFKLVPCYDEDDVVSGYRGTLTDVSIRKSAEHKALYLSLHDELTGLPNRRALSNDILQAIDRAEHTGSTVVVAGVDLDGFKAINDAYGHAVGDELLNQVAQRLRRFLRPVDIAYRTGGDEFVVLFDSLDSSVAARMSQSVSTRLIEHLSEPYELHTLKVQIGASIGLSSYPEDELRAQDLLRMADLALYAAKDAGKGCVISFSPEHDRDAEFQRDMEQDLRRAISDNELYLMYQPQVNTITEQVIGYEALLRWKHPERGDISPADFIPMAEKLNLMDGIGEFVLRSACEFASTWPVQQDGLQPRVSVNVSPKQFSNSGFVTLVKEVLDRYGLQPSRLELEVTEDVLIDDFDSVSTVLKQLRDMGVAIAVDDFGSGQTSLRYLNQFPLTTIKIDRSFIRNLGHSDKAAEITRTIVMLGQKLGINVIAEGVEETDQLDLLRRWNCDQIQGFLFSQPMSIEDVSETLKHSELQHTQNRSNGTR